LLQEAEWFNPLYLFLRSFTVWRLTDFGIGNIRESLKKAENFESISISILDRKSEPMT
jgi:hypothetical protein